MGEGGLIFAAVFAGISAFASYYASDKIALAISHARPVTKDEFPHLFNVVEGLTIAAGIPAPTLLRHQRHGPERVCHGAQSGALGHLRHDRPSGKAEPGRA